jgi:DNA-binding NarL/FixJ family response regulator
VPDDVCGVLEAAMAKDPADRPASAALIAQLLEQVLTGGTAMSYPGTSSRSHTIVVRPSDSSPQPKSPAAVRVIVADDHPLYRNGISATLASMGNFEIVAEASTGEEAVTAADTESPDVIVMDINMPVMNGIEATRRIVELHPEASVLMLTMDDDDDSVFAAMQAGARGYVLKGAGGEEIVRAVRAVAGGEAIFSPAIAGRIIRYFSSPRPSSPAEPFPQLTEREREILELIAQGASNASIADRLLVDEGTVRNHVSTICDKLQVADRAQAVIRAREAGMGRQS